MTRRPPRRRRPAVSARTIGLFAGLLLLAGCSGEPTPLPPVDGMIDVTQPPDRVRVVTETGTADAAVSDLARVTFTAEDGMLRVRLAAPNAAVKRIELHWDGGLDPKARLLGDAWERSYADLGWRSLKDGGDMPWYFLLTDPASGATDGYGVQTAPAAMCHWTADARGVTLIADVRSGGVGVTLGGRTLDVCTVVARPGKTGESAFDAAAAFCRQMCPDPRLPQRPVYGYNDWNSTYGRNTADGFLRDAAALAALCPDGPNRPFMVVDDGWQADRQGGEAGDNPWDRTNNRFGSTMADLANGVKAMDARPGLWYRPLKAWPSAPKDQLLRGNVRVFDPSLPAVRERIAADVRRFRGWGFELLKHDFTSIEIFGKNGKDMDGGGADDGWAFADRTRTTAEVILDLYRTIRDAAGEDMTVLGCNTISHLSAGMFEVSRIGDDTSGEEWDRTLRFGVNALAFRAPQQGAFYAVDPDMVGLAKAGAVPWEKNRQWLDLVARSGTTLFVSWKVELIDDAVRGALRDAFAAAAEPRPVARPLDWLDSRTPGRWSLGGKEETFSW